MNFNQQFAVYLLVVHLETDSCCMFSLQTISASCALYDYREGFLLQLLICKTDLKLQDDWKFNFQKGDTFMKLYENQINFKYL